MNTEVGNLVAELQIHIGLSRVDAQRTAFCVLAYNQGWGAARTGRYLGISRTRVGQRVDRLRRHAESGESMPLLAHWLATAAPIQLDMDQSVGFDMGDWENQDFAMGMLDQLAA